MEAFASCLISLIRTLTTESWVGGKPAGRLSFETWAFSLSCFWQCQGRMVFCKCGEWNDLCMGGSCRQFLSQMGGWDADLFICEIFTCSFWEDVVCQEMESCVSKGWHGPTRKRFSHKEKYRVMGYPPRKYSWMDWTMKSLVTPWLDKEVLKWDHNHVGLLFYKC